MPTMVTEFKIGMSASEVVQTIVETNKEISAVKLILHPVGINWRQKYTTPEEQSSHYKEGLYQSKPLKTRVVFRSSIITDLDDEIERIQEGCEDKQTTVSVTSKITLSSGKKRHLAMMNFHPEIEESKRLELIIDFLEEIGEKEGVILASSRYFHYYGTRLLSEREWIVFSATFLKPASLVSPRYVANCFCDGYSTLRLTREEIYKSTVPRVVSIIKID